MAHELLTLGTVPRGARPVRGPAFYTIFLRDFVAASPADEAGALRVNVELKVRHPGPGFADDIASVMSYEDVVSGIRRLTQDRLTHEGPVDGLETLASGIGDLCLVDPRVEGAQVRVERLANGAEPEALGITMEFARNGLRPGGKA